jgi:hypothetical protein
MKATREARKRELIKRLLEIRASEIEVEIELAQLKREMNDYEEERQMSFHFPYTAVKAETPLPYTESCCGV